MGFPLISMHFQSNVVPDPGSIPFFEQKIQGLFKDTFCIFQGLHSVQSLCLFLVLPHQENFIPKVFVFAPFPLQFLLNSYVSIEIQGISSTDCNFQGLSRPWIFFLKFKNFQGFSRCMQMLQTCFHCCMEIGHILFIVNSWSQYGRRDIALLIFDSACMTY